MDFKKFMDKLVQIETRQLLNILAVVIVIGMIAVFFSGYILGSAIQQSECFEYFAWYKVVYDCKECGKWNPVQLQEMERYLEEDD